MQSSSFTHPGVREQNDHSLYPSPGAVSPGWYIVADGSGEHAGGKFASQLAVQTVCQILGKEDPRAYILGGATMAEGKLIENYLQAVVRQTNVDVWQAARQRGSVMETTLLVVLIHGERGYCAQVGNCALFVSSDGISPMKKVTNEHRRGTGLFQTLGASDQVTPEVVSFEFSPKSVLLMGCVGFWEWVPVETTSKLLLQQPYFSVAEILGQAALKAGSQDNVSLVVVEGEDFIREHATAQVKAYVEILKSDPDLAMAGVMTWSLSAFAAKYGVQLDLNLPSKPAEQLPEGMVFPLVGEYESMDGTNRALEIKQLTDQVIFLQKEKADLEQKLTAWQAEKADLQQQINTLATTVDEMKQRAAVPSRQDAEPEKSALLLVEKARLEEVNTHIRNLLSEQTQKMDETQKAIKELQDRLFSAQSAYANLEQEFTKTKADLADQVQRNQTLEQIIREGQLQRSTMQAERGSLADLMGEKVQLEDQVGYLRKSLEAQQREFDALKAQFENIKNANTYMEAQKTWVEQELAATKAGKQELEKNQTAWQEQVQNMQAQLEALRQEKAEIERQLASIKNDKLGVEVALTNTRVLIDSQQKKIDQLQQENRNLAQQLAEQQASETRPMGGDTGSNARILQLVNDKNELGKHIRELRDQIDTLRGSQVELSELRDKIDHLQRMLGQKDSIIQQMERQLEIKTTQSSWTEPNRQTQDEIQRLRDENDRLASDILNQRTELLSHRRNALKAYREMIRIHDRYPTECEDVFPGRWIQNIRNLVTREEAFLAGLELPGN